GDTELAKVGRNPQKETVSPLTPRNRNLYGEAMSQDITYFAETDFRGKHTPFGIKRGDRQYHMAIIGRTGMGKSTLMETLMAADIHAGSGFALLDPHGDTAETIVKMIPPER